jgi:1,4-alpha-glucan branching enzyme
MYKVLEAPIATTELGATLLPNNLLTCLVWALNASKVTIRIAPDAVTPYTDLELSAGPDPGYWSAKLSGAGPGQRYLFRIMNNGIGPDNPGTLLDRTDPCALEATGSQPGLAGIVVDPGSYRFQSPFQTPRFENFIVYQAHVGSFTGRNDGLPSIQDGNGWTANFDNVVSKLDYIRSLNFNAIQFLPTGEYRGTEGEAYNPSNYFAPEILYGTPDQLRALIDACHARGLAVFFDVVYNHMDGGDNLWQFDGNTGHRTNVSDPGSGGGIYFSNIQTDFGRRPDHDSPDVQRFFTANASMWFDQYQVDGLRFDSVPNFSRNGLFAILQSLLKRYPNKFIYAEDPDPAYAIGNLGFPASWEMNSPAAFYRAAAYGDLGQLRTFLDQEGYPTPYAAIRYPLGSHDQIFNEWKQPDNNNPAWHWDKGADYDLPENRYFVERIGGAVTGRSNWYALAKARMGWGLAVAAPGTPLLFMGTEVHHYGYWNAATDTYGDHRFDWSIAGDPTAWDMRNLVADANNVRWTNDALRSGPGFSIPHSDEKNHILGFLRWNYGGNVILTVVNLSDNQWDDPIYGVVGGSPGDFWTEIFNSQAPQYGGWVNSGNYAAQLRVQPDGYLYIRMPKWSVLIFRKG